MLIQELDQLAGPYTEFPTRVRTIRDTVRLNGKSTVTSRTTIDRPTQQVTHDIASLHGVVFGALGSLEATYAYDEKTRICREALRRAL